MKYHLNLKRFTGGTFMLLAASLCLSNIGAAPAQDKREASMRSVDSAQLMKSNSFAVPKSSSALEHHAGDGASSTGKTGKSLFTGHIQLNRASPPEAGIRLLQDILQRVRNVPQIAMAKPKYQSEQNTLNVQQAAQGPTDYRLAIRPQEIATPPVLQPEIKKGSNVIAWGDLPKTKLDGAVTSGGDNPDYGSVTTGDSALSGKKGFWERDVDALGKNRNQKSKDAKEAKEAISAGAPAGIAMDDSVEGYGYSNAQGIWERERAKAEAAVNKLSPESRQRLSNSANKLFNLAQGLEAAQQSVERRPASSASDEESKTRGAVLTASKSKRSYASGFRAEKERPSGGARESQLLADKQNINDFRAPAPIQSYGGYAGGGAGYTGNETVRGKLAASHGMTSQPVPMSAGRSLKTPYPSLAPAPMPRTAGAVSNVVPVDNFYADQSASFRRNDQAVRREQRLAEVALLPPNVVTGIPLVRLGYSETQAMQALATLGNSERHTTSNGWTVLTFRKPGTKSSAVQVYMRNGQVEALRIFDSALVGPDFGVRLGDELSSVKLRFGEPAFILSEPLSGSGQNYVYPISQVAFQLSRPSRGAKPEVVSLLIFNVK